MDDPIGKMAAFHGALGVEALDVRERAAAVSLVTRCADACAQHSERLTSALWTVLGDLESGASDEVLLSGLLRAGSALTRAILDLYGTAQLLGFLGVEQSIAQEYDARMSALHGGRYRPVTLTGFVALPGA